MSKRIPENVAKELIGPGSLIGCEKCGHSGFVNINKDGYSFMEPCDCYRTYQLNMLKERSNIPEIYINASFSLDESVSFMRFLPLSYKETSELVDGVKVNRRQLQFKNKPIKMDINGFGAQYVDVAIKHLKQSPRTKSIGLILSGEVGSGKTMFACAIANAFIEKGLNVHYLKTKQYIDNVIKDSFGKDDDKVKILKKKRDYLNGFNKNLKDNCHLLILDELGYEYQKADSGFALAEIKDLLRNRAEKSLPTIITTNFMLDELTRVYEEELISMFAESYMFFYVVCSDDYRIKKSAELDEDFDFDSIKL